MKIIAVDELYLQGRSCVHDLATSLYYKMYFSQSIHTPEWGSLEVRPFEFQSVEEHNKDNPREFPCNLELSFVGNIWADKLFIGRDA